MESAVWMASSRLQVTTMDSTVIPRRSRRMGEPSATFRPTHLWAWLTDRSCRVNRGMNRRVMLRIRLRAGMTRPKR